MKKSILIAIILYSTCAAFAQKDTEAQKILTKMSQKYKTYQSIYALFTLKTSQGSYTQSQKGTLWLKDNQYKIILPNQQVISDGKNIWFYNQDIEEVQLSSTTNQSQNTFSPSTIFTFYQKGYKYIQTPDIKRQNTLYHVIDLTPINPSNYFKIRLTIQKNNTSLLSVEIFSKDASRFLYILNYVKPNTNIPNQYFTFDTTKFPNVEIIDLR